MADTVPCPRCKESIKVGALVCRYCQHQLAADEVRQGLQAARSKSNYKALAVIGGVLLVGWCVSNVPSTPGTSGLAGSSGTQSPGVFTPAAIIVKTDDAYAKASAASHCGDRYPADFSMRAACGRNASSGRGDFIDIWNRYLTVPAMMSALENCFDRYTQGAVTDFAMAGACARNQERGYRDTMN